MSSTAYVGARRERIGTATMLTEGLRRVREHWIAFAVFVAVVGGLNLGLELATKALGVVTTDTTTKPGELGYIAANCLLAGAAGAVAVRVLLDGPLRPGRAMAEGALLLSGLQATVMLPPTLLDAVPMASVGQAFMAFMLLFLAGAVVLFVVLVRLTLWPIGRIAARPEVTAAASWRLMRRATRGYVLASVVLGIPFGVVVIGGLRLLGEDYFAPGPASLAATTITSFAGAAFMFAASAMSVAVFVRRVVTPSSLADVFG